MFRRRLAVPILVVLLSAALLPSASHAATIQSGQDISVSTSTPDNLYIGGGTINVDAPLPQDLVAAGGRITVAAPVGRDALLAGGTVDVQQPITGNARIAGGRITINNNVGGDLAAAGAFITVNGKANNLLLAGDAVNVTNGAVGTTTIYAADVTLAGEFNGDVEVVASDKLTVADGTIIHGTLKYNAPVQATIPSTATIDKGVQYIGSAPFIPTPKQAETFATAGLWIFFIVRVIAALVVVGLVTGFFPVLNERVIESALTRSFERSMLLLLLGFAAFVAIPVLIILLLVSFVGIGLALLLGAAYFILILFSYIYAAVLAGSALVWIFRKHTEISWRGALLGVIVLELIGIIPVIGFVLKLVLAATAGGALLVLFYRFAFRRSEQELLDI